MRVALLFVAACGFKGAALTSDGQAIDAPQAGDVARPADAEALDAPLAIDAQVVDAAPPVDANAWPCGAMPPSPPDPLMFGNATKSLKASNIDVDGAQLVVATKGEALRMRFAFTIHDASCGQCIDQIEYGLVNAANSGHRIDCAFDGAMNSQTQSATGNADETFTAPTTAGQYTLRLGLTEQYRCSDHSDWSEGQPPANQTIAIICVH